MTRPLLTRISIYLVVWAAAGIVQADAGPASRVIGERGALLPLTNYSGRADAAVRVERELADRLDLRLQLSLDRGTDVRTVARELRIRNLTAEPPDRLTLLAEGLGVGWLLLPTLFVSDDAPLPRVALAAKILQKDSDVVLWAGYVSTTGLSDAGVLGRSLIDNQEELERVAVESLIEDLAMSLEGQATRSPKPWQVRGFAANELTKEHLQRIAIVPFDSFVDSDAQTAGALVTELAYVSLFRLGYLPLAPGLIQDAFRKTTSAQAGSVDPEFRALLVESTGVRSILTGTIDVLDFAARGPEPEPMIEMGTRLVGAEDGRILWTTEAAHKGWDHQAPFGFRRIYSPEELAETIVSSMSANLVTAANRSGHRRTQ